MNSQNIMFVILAVFIILSSVATVVTKSVIRAATYLLFVLLGTAGLYFLMGYTFLGSAQIMVYAGGIIVLYVFAILLTEDGKDEAFKRKAKDASWALLLTLAGFGTFLCVLLKNRLFGDIVALSAPSETGSESIKINDIGEMLLSAGENGYLYPFEAVSVLLLACIVCGLIIARKR